MSAFYIRTLYCRGVGRNRDVEDQWIGQRVQELRQARGMTQGELAVAANRLGGAFHQQTIQKIEAGARPVRFSEAVKLTLALGVNIDALSGDKPELDRQFAAAQSSLREVELAASQLERAAGDWLSARRKAEHQIELYADVAHLDDTGIREVSEPLEEAEARIQLAVSRLRGQEHRDG